jgi:hypothetical protein
LLTDQVQAVWDHPNPRNITVILSIVILGPALVLWIRYRLKLKANKPDENRLKTVTGEE